MLVEVCANSLQSALNAQEAGADRIELCSELAVGGVTPSLGLLKAVREQVDIPVHVLIRPRSGDFSYSDREFEIMKTDIANCLDMGFDGIVSGILHPDFKLDAERTSELIKASQGGHFTFHRAFDWVSDPFNVLSLLEDMGADCILTSGQRTSAPDGLELLEELNAKASSLTIMPGGGIHPKNASMFREKGFKIIHLSGSKQVRTLSSPPPVPMNSASLLKEEGISVSNADRIRKVIKVVR